MELCLAADAKFESFLQSSNPEGPIMTSNEQSLQEGTEQPENELESSREANQIFTEATAEAPQQQSDQGNQVAEPEEQPINDSGGEEQRQAARSHALTWPVEAPATTTGFFRQDGAPLALSPEGSVIVLGKMQQDGTVSALLPREDCQDILLMVELKYNKDMVVPELPAQQQALSQVQQQPIKARILNYAADTQNVGRGKEMPTTSETGDAPFVSGDNPQETSLSYSAALSADSQPVAFADTNVTATFSKEQTLSFMAMAFAQGAPIEDYAEECQTPKIEYVDADDAVTDLVYESDAMSETTDVKPNVDDSQKPFECTECGKRFMRRTNLRSHLAIHTSDRPHTCDTCGKSFAVRWDLTLHARLHTGAYSCEVCGKAFSVRGKLDRHRRVHSGERPFSCPQCGKAFSDKHNLEAHVRTHSDQRPFSCSQCGNSFRSRSHLRAHRRVHSQDTPFVCHLCGKSFKWKANLNLHIKVHSGERVKCECCGREFARPADLVRHRRCHDGIRPHNCTVCAKTYTDRAALNKHMKSHAEHRPFVCDICHKGFHFQWYLNTHKKNHEIQSSKKYICGTCGKEFPRRISLIGHERFHLVDSQKTASSPAPLVASPSSQPAPA